MPQPLRRNIGKGSLLVTRPMWRFVASALFVRRCCVQRGLWPKLQKSGGLAPDDGGASLFGRSFVSFLGGQTWLWGKRPPVPGRCMGLRTAPARIRGGTPRHSRTQRLRFQAAGFGYEFRGWAAAGLLCEQPHEVQICIARTEPFRLPGLRRVCNSAVRGWGWKRPCVVLYVLVQSQALPRQPLTRSLSA